MPDALLEIWQADASGKYDHPEDTQDKPLDPRFRGFGRAATDAQGVYRFTTVKPGPVPGPGNTLQAPHINVTVFARGLLKHLVTRIYFADQAEAQRGRPAAGVDRGRRRAQHDDRRAGQRHRQSRSTASTSSCRARAKRRSSSSEPAMTVNPADSAILGALFGTDAMRARLRRRTAGLQRMLDVEAALARVEARLGIIPAEAAAAITARGEGREPVDRGAGAPARATSAIRSSAWSRRWARLAGGDAGALRPLGRHHAGHPRHAPLVLQIRDGLALIAHGHWSRIARALVAQAQTHRRDRDGRAHPPPARAAGHLRLQVRCLARRRCSTTCASASTRCAPRVLKVQFGGAVGTLASLGDEGSAVQRGPGGGARPRRARLRLARRARRRWRRWRLARPPVRQPLPRSRPTSSS